jgi:hypothetical protein
MKRLFPLLFLGGLLFAQDAPPPKWQQKVFDLKYIDPRPLQNLLASLQVRSDTRVNANVDLKAVTVGTYEPNFIALAEELVTRYDKPNSSARSSARNIELVVHMILAAPTGSAGAALPPDLDGVAKQLKAVFGYNDLHLMDTAVLRNREGRGGDFSGNAGKPDAGLPPGATSIYNIRYKDTALTAEQGKPNMIRLDELRFSMRIPYVTGTFQANSGSPLVNTQFQFSEVGFYTNLDIREGQKVVVGKNKIDSSDKALILVVSARAVD